MAQVPAAVLGARQIQRFRDNPCAAAGPFVGCTGRHHSKGAECKRLRQASADKQTFQRRIQPCKPVSRTCVFSCVSARSRRRVYLRKTTDECVPKLVVLGV